MTGNGLTGLANVGNTCYLNSCIQALSHTQELHETVARSGRVPGRLRRCAESLALTEWNKLRDMMWKEDCTIAPHGFVGALDRVSKARKMDIGIGTEQNDAQEFLQFLMECFHTSLGREVSMTVDGTPKTDQDRMAQACYQAVRDLYKNEYSEMLPLFYGVHVSLVQDIDGAVHSRRPEPFSVLAMPLPSAPGPCTLYQCFDAYCAASHLRGDNQYETASGEKVDATRSLFFWNLPRIMIVHLKRWNMMGRKDQRRIECPLELQMEPYVRGYNADKYVYQLYAVCNHSGGVHGGHYTADISPHGTDDWYEFNDTRIRKLSKPSASVSSAGAYCLFYRKKNSDVHV